MKLSGYTASATNGRLFMKATVAIDAPILKRELLYTIAELVQNGTNPIRPKKEFLETVRSNIELYGVSGFIGKYPPIQYSKSEDDILETTNKTWMEFFPGKPPTKIDFEIVISVSTDDMLKALAYARTFLAISEEDIGEPDIPSFDTAQILYWVIHSYIEAGTTTLQQFEAIRTDIREMCKDAIQKHFCFLNLEYESGAWTDI